MVPLCGIAMEELFKAQNSRGLYTNLLMQGEEGFGEGKVSFTGCLKYGGYQGKYSVLD
jgi:hypothetical protein